MLRVSQLHGFNAVRAAAGAPTLTFRTAVFDTGDRTIYDQAAFDGLSIGTASADRYVIVAVGGSANNVTISSVSIGGVAATAAVTALDNDGVSWLQTGIYIALVPTGTTADVIVTFSGGNTRCHIAVWTVTGLNSATANDTANSGASTGLLDVDVPADGIAIAYTHTADYTTGTTTTWAGVTERFDAAAGDSGTYTSSGGDYSGAAATPLTVTSTPSAAADASSHVSASWR